MAISTSELCAVWRASTPPVSGVLFPLILQSLAPRDLAAYQYIERNPGITSLTYALVMNIRHNHALGILGRLYVLGLLDRTRAHDNVYAWTARHDPPPDSYRTLSQLTD